ncbi:chorismate-binding protein [Kitasatospora viridis]|uniref:Anthranilate/para-aminobenzoate synthase component I n=1 Tax=Kitasatospora viridis TaxID=281105 RepID=A0A561TTK4_9ACTN|nr:chorismate-binding protein [Kitasatospora viridis]TWF90433.1 anthranilate/para-aminobenzoate synthase component I [Kitasatospora viridis]
MSDLHVLPERARLVTTARAWAHALAEHADPHEDLVVYGGPDTFLVGVGSSARLALDPGEANPWPAVTEFLDHAAGAPVLGHLAPDLLRPPHADTPPPGYPASWLTLPRLLFQVDATGPTVLRGRPGPDWDEVRPADRAAPRAAPLDGTGEQDRPAYELAVRRALDWIDGDPDRRATVARRIEVAPHFPLTRLLLTGPPPNPTCRLFHVRHDGFLMSGNSPELLVHGNLAAFRSYKLAGTGPRQRGSADRELAAAFLRDHKILAEHAATLAAWRRSLRRLGAVVGAGPTVLDRHRLRHLMTVLTVQADHASLTDLLRAALPAPATPPADLPFPRGAYHGIVGRFQPGRLSLSKVVRTVFQESGQTYAFAGATVTRDSTPAGEWADTCHKFADIEVPVEL